MLATLQRWWPWLPDPGPAREVVRTSEEGLRDREVEEFAILHDERARLQGEESSGGSVASQDGETPIEGGFTSTTDGKLL